MLRSRNQCMNMAISTIEIDLLNTLCNLPTTTMTICQVKISAMNKCKLSQTKHSKVVRFIIIIESNCPLMSVSINMSICAGLFCRMIIHVLPSGNQERMLGMNPINRLDSSTLLYMSWDLYFQYCRVSWTLFMYSVSKCER
jgi:hypothetical protein